MSIEQAPARKRVTLRLSISVPPDWTRKAVQDMVERTLATYGPGNPGAMSPYAKVLQED